SAMGERQGTAATNEGRLKNEKGRCRWRRPLLFRWMPVVGSDRAKAAGDQNRGSFRHAVVKVDHVLVDHAHATVRDGLADGPSFGRTVNAVQRVLAILVIEIEGAGAEWIVDPGLHAAQPGVGRLVVGGAIL